MSVLAAIQYALFKDPNHNVYGGTDAARNLAAIRLPDNPPWSNKGWWATAVSDCAPGDVPDSSPGGGVTFFGGDTIEISGTENGGATYEYNGRGHIRDNGQATNPFTNLLNIRESQLYSTLLEVRCRIYSGSTDAIYFIGLCKSNVGASTLAGWERIIGISNTVDTANWRATTMRNATPNNGTPPGSTLKSTSLGVTGTVFRNFVLEISGGGSSARWRASSGAWTNNKIPIVTTATSSELLSRRGEGPVSWGVEVRHTLTPPIQAATLRLSRLSIHCFRPGFIGTKPTYQYTAK
jgi:hypothetical protein